MASLALFGRAAQFAASINDTAAPHAQLLARDARLAPPSPPPSILELLELLEPVHGRQLANDPPNPSPPPPSPSPPQPHSPHPQHDVEMGRSGMSDNGGVPLAMAIGLGAGAFVLGVALTHGVQQLQLRSKLAERRQRQSQVLKEISMTTVG